ncbi:pentapeptide repeat-containing protein [Nodosilinea sp. PGN35]|uniref:pentapeptide repeat-containing protein n=1 Tax=Nodosilinea sp. PGN35 TaxID=3020489 RepID=UPI0023B2AC97|nr:pentapeptide repeat-containing protein [Nodosilinea sp. TSF1-S3]MDF0367569.1 pentapeptide repeat-containing protein [Nodosilinea sp. TSF1-S3]
MVSRSRLCRMFVATLMVLTLCLGWGTAAQATSYDRQNLRQSDWSHQDLRGNDYTRADMADADMSHTNLRGVRLFDTTLARANMEGADMTGATLDGARFVQANLTNAILAGAYAFGTDFREAIIDGADFTDVLLDPKVNKMLCDVAQGINPVTGRKTRDTLYCP